MVFEKSREEFVVWIRMAINDHRSGAYDELYGFLCQCFVRADVKRCGKVDLNHFDALIEEAAELPRRYGYAPKSEAMYPSEGLRTAARAKQFLDMDTDNTGYITLSQWIKFAVNHIVGKVTTLPKDYLAGSSADVSKGEFISFIKRAVDPKNPEYKELYFFLLRTFQAGDKEGKGVVGPHDFDKMIEVAAEAPRRHGLAPKTSVMFKNDSERIANRMETFSKLDKTGAGKISFDNWLSYALEHINGKAKSI